MCSRPRSFRLCPAAVRFIELVYEPFDDGGRLLVKHRQNRFAAYDANNAPRHLKTTALVLQLRRDDIDRGLTVGRGFQREQVWMCCERLKQLAGEAVCHH